MPTVGSEDVLVAIKALPKGATRAQIMEKLGNPFSKRNLSRYLAPLEDMKRVRTEKAGKEVLYFVCEDNPAKSAKSDERKPRPIESLGSAGGATPKQGPAEGGQDSVEPPQAENGAGDAGHVSEVKAEKADGRPTGGVSGAAEPTEAMGAGTDDGEPKDSNLKSATAGPAADPGVDPDFPAMAELVALDVVLGGLTKQGAVLLLQKAAREYHKEGDAVMAFVRYALGRIDRFGAVDVQDLGIPAAQFADWQRRWSGNYDYPPSATSNLQSVPETPAATDGEHSRTSAAQPGKTKADREHSSAGKTGAQPKDNAKAATGTGTTPARTADELSADLPMTESAVRMSAANGLANALTDWIARRVPGGLTRTQRVGILSGLGAFTVVLYQALSQYKWVAAGVPLLFAVGLVVFGRRGPAPTDGRDLTPPISELKAAAAAGRRRSRGWYFLFAVAGLAVIVGTAWWLAHRPPAAPRPPEDAVRQYLVKNAGPLPVRLADLRVTYGTATAANCRVSYEARFETAEPLFRRIDAVEYLRTHYADELAGIDAAAALLREPDASRIRAAVGDQGPATRDQGLGIPQSAGSSLDSQPSTLNSSTGASAPVLVTTATPPGASATATGTLVAWKHDTTWIFTGDPVRLDRGALTGDLKPAGALAVDLPEDAARLQALIAEQVAYAAKVQAAAKALADQRERDVQQRKAAFAELLRVGSLFTGVVNDPTKHQPQRFVLEITAATPPRLTAVLRNDGGWTDARAFQGEWSVDADGEIATVTLRTTSNAAMNGAGPLLQERTDWALAFGLRADGTAAAPAGDLKSQISSFKSAAATATVERVDPAAAADLKAAWTRGVAAVLSATRAGAMYRGTALSKIYRTTDAVVLRFGGPAAPTGPVQGSTFKVQGSARAEATPVILDATLAPAGGGGAGRAFRGTVIANTYRAGGTPIRLQSADTDRVAGTDGKSVFGIVTGAGLTMALRLNGDRLVGEDAWFTYEFAPEPDANEDQTPGTNDEGLGNPQSEIRNPQLPAPIENRDSRIENPPIPQSAVRTPQSLPPFPAASGAYGLVSGRWVALPNNHPQVAQKGKRIFDSFFSALEDFERKLAGQPVQPASQIYGALTFDGRDAVPWLPADAVVICYVGELQPINPALLKKYPALNLEPLMELGMLHDVGSSRSILLTSVYPGIPGFGPRHIEATVEQRPPNVVLLRARGPLAVGRYAVTCNDQLYEVGVVAAVP